MARKTQQKELSLRPIEKALKEILRGLRQLNKQKDLAPKAKRTLEKDIKNVQKLIKEIPPVCRAYTFR
ncbi:MAG TPA: hypothetical protein VMU53_16240 [Candidatus Sulfotelmatobacter sp.]|nr:hypothetical protein [Candidatus Sulfotelmatobacter sp.]